MGAESAGIPLSQYEIKRKEVDILLAFHDFCHINKLRYTLAYGTLIGAVRHKGFIPWDDDIDVIMPRPDYDRFIDLALSGFYPGDYRVQATEIDGFLQSFAKVIDPRVAVKSGRNLSSDGEWLWIDVFPVDGLPESAHCRSALYQLTKVLSTLCVVGQLDPCYKSTLLMQLSAFIFGPIARHSNLSMRANRFLNKISTKIEFGATGYAGVIGWGFGQRESFPPVYFTDRIMMPFESHYFYGPREYDRILRCQYGDYMELPPENERVTHELTAWLIHDQQNMPVDYLSR